jgi:predicted  nucleic acid-binding Zn-ribbon protein
MKNIYDIIAEQKANVDVNIATYDLNYTISQFSDYHDFVQEGFGEAVKNVAKSVVEFIKKLIERIRELVKKVIGFFSSSSSGKTVEEDLNEKIESHNKKLEKVKNDIQKMDDEAKRAMDEIDKAHEKNKQRAAEAEKARAEHEERIRNYDAEIKKKEEEIEARRRPQVVVSDLHELLSRSFLEIECERFGPMKQKSEFIGNLPNKFDRLYADGCKELREKGSIPLFRVQATEKLFYGDEDDDIMNCMREYFGDDGITTKFKVFQRADEIYAYIHYHKDYVKIFKKTEDVMTKRFKDIIRMIETGKYDGTEDERHANLLCSYSKMACNVAALIINYLIQSTMRAFNICTKIARDATGEYCSRKYSNFNYEQEKY